MKWSFFSPAAKSVAISCRMRPVAVSENRVLVLSLFVFMLGAAPILAGQRVPDVPEPTCVPSIYGDCGRSSYSSSGSRENSAANAHAIRNAHAKAIRNAQQMQQLQGVVDKIINGDPAFTAAVNRKIEEIKQANTALALEQQGQQESRMLHSARTAQERRDQKIADLSANIVGVPKDSGDMSGLIRGLPANQQPLETSLEEHAAIARGGFDNKGPLMAEPVKQPPKPPKPFDPRNTEAKDIPKERRTPEIDKMLEHRDELRRKEAELRKELETTPPGSQAWIDKSGAADKLHGEENWDTFNISEGLRNNSAGMSLTAGYK